jgi:DNA-binding XRE family transcriptional regulator
MKYSLKAIRVNAKENQEETAKAIGVSPETWANYEKGKTFPDIPVLKKIEAHFNITYNDIDFFCNENTKIS